jgi:cyclomaltodextrinase
MLYPALSEAALCRPDEQPVLLSYRPPLPVGGVDVLGELETWLTPLPMTVSEGNLRELALWLAPGVYAYKLRHDDGSYHLDPHNPRTAQRDEHRNSVLVVGGTPEPVLHAPRAPYLWQRDDGRLCVRAALRDGAGTSLRVRWDEGHGSVVTAMHEVAREGEHTLYEAHLPVSAGRVSYLFVLASGALVGRAGEQAVPFVHTRTRAAPLPAWWQRGVMYSLFVDRFRRGQGEPFRALSNERDRAGGDLWGVIEALPYLHELGVSILQLTPIALSPSAHRYDAIDPRVVDPALGGEEALRSLLEAAHARDMRVLLDVAGTHVHRDHFAFRDVRARGPASPYWSWFFAYRFPFDEGPDGGYLHYPKGQWHEPLLRTTHPDVAEEVVGHFEHYARLGVDGFRIDAACSLPVGLSRKICRAVRRINPGAVVFGEVTVDNGARWVGGAALHAATDFVAQAAERRFLQGEIDAAACTQVFAQRRFYRAGEGPSALAFTANHDQARLTTLLGDRALARAAHVLLLARAELPALYYGDELGLCSDERARSFEDAWPDRVAMPWQRDTWDEATLDLIRKLVHLRRACRALYAGEESWLSARDGSGAPLGDVLCLRRTAGDETVEVFVHRGAEPVTVQLPEGAASAAELVLCSGEARVHEGVLVLGPKSAAIVRRTLAGEVAAWWQSSLARASEQARTAFASGDLEVPYLPPRLYLTMTERCNLRCAHCITHAPRLTREGRARSLAPWLLPRLSDAFRAASYLGFVHGGESLVAEDFFPTLAFVQAQRKSVATRLDIHLLSNGMLLTEERVHRLIDHGVTSLAVSLDGASARSNDKLRIGGSFDTVVRNIQAALTLRARLGADLRIGISSVLSRDNLAELAALGRLCERLGVDWLKIEEMHPSTRVAAEQALAADDGALGAARAALAQELEKSRVVLVDHLQSGLPCACSGTERAVHFRAADDFANRAHFRPCRMLWEQAAIDPDGTVRPVDYGHAALGSLLHAPLVELWNGETLRLARARVRQRLHASARERCARS